MNESDRHARHHSFSPIGRAGQEKLAQARIAVVGCGALGSHAAELLARAGVATGPDGLLRLIDRDLVEISNLQRQALFDTADARASRPKARAAADHIRQIDPEVRTEPLVRDLNGANALRLLDAVDLIIDGTDNFRARFVINDAAIATGTPWIYGGAVGGRGMCAFIKPPETACLRCFLEALPPFGSFDNCETAGVFTPLPAAVAAIQTAKALRYLVSGEWQSGVTTFDFWGSPGDTRRILHEISPLADCRSCGTGQLPALHEEVDEIASLCGRNSVQIWSGVPADLKLTAARLEHLAQLDQQDETLSVSIPEGRLILFSDGRLIIEGTTDPLEARAIAGRYLGG
jgi:molybdopterin-synthase adenylyltransferase